MEKKISITYKRNGELMREFTETDLMAAFLMVEYEFAYGGRVTCISRTKSANGSGDLTVEVKTRVMSHIDSMTLCGKCDDMKSVITAVHLHARSLSDKERVDYTVELAHRITGGIPLLVGTMGLMAMGMGMSFDIMPLVLDLDTRQADRYIRMSKKDRQFVVEAVDTGEYGIDEIIGAV